MRDDGVGVHAARLLRERLPAEVAVAEVGTAALDSLGLLENADLVLAIDAMQAGGAPGTIHTLGVEDVASDQEPHSLHQMSLTCVLGFLAEDQRPRVTVLGVEPAEIELGTGLSPAVEAALPAVVEAAARIVGEWVG